MPERFHGQYGTRLYHCWDGMIQRCSNPNHNAYCRYGKVGITVCEEWRKDFMIFFHWAHENGYSDELEIDRIDNKRGYEPSNCRWATEAQQMWNTGKQKGTSSKYKGVYWHKGANKWMAYLTVHGQYNYLGLFTSEEDAARAYDSRAMKLHGEFAQVNFP